MFRPTAILILVTLCSSLVAQDLPTGAVLRIGSSKFVHGGEIRAIAFSPDGKLIVSANADFQNPLIRVWDAETGREVKSLKGHKNTVARLAFLPGDAKTPPTLVSAGADSTIRFWNVKTGEELPHIINHPGPVSALAITADGKKIASGGGNTKHIFLWDATNGKELLRWEAHDGGTVALSFGPDGKTLASGGASKIDPRGGNIPKDNKTVALWDTANGKLLKNFAGHDFHVTGVALSSDGKVIIAGGQFYRTGSPLWWDTETGKQLHNVRGSCYGITLTPDGKTMAVADTGNIHFFDVETAAPQQPLQHRHQLFPRAMAFSPDGNTLATAGSEGRIVLWDARRRTEKKDEGSLSQAVRGVAVSPDGKAIMTIGGDGVLFWDKTNGKLLRKLESTDRRPGFAWTGQFLPDNRTALVAQVRDSIGFWDWTNGQHLRTVEYDHKLVTLRSTTPDGSLFVTGGHSSKDIIIWESATGKAVKSIPAPVNNKNVFVRAATISPNGEFLLAIGLFDHQVHDIESGKVVYYKKFSGFAPAFSPGGVVLAMWGFKTGQSVQLMETATGKELAALPLGAGASHGEQIVFSPDGRLLVLVESGSRLTDPSAVKVFDLATGKSKSLAGHRGKVSMAAFTPDSKAIVTGSDDATALVWDVSDLIAKEKIDVKASWNEMAKADRRAAYIAFCRLRAVPEETLPLLKKELSKPAPAGELEKLRRAWAVRLLEDVRSASARELLADLAGASKDAAAAVKRLQRNP